MFMENQDNQSYRIEQLEKVLERLGNKINQDSKLSEEEKLEYIHIIQAGIPFNQQFNR